MLQQGTHYLILGRMQGVFFRANTQRIKTVVQLPRHSWHH